MFFVADPRLNTQQITQHEISNPSDNYNVESDLVTG